LQHRTDREIRLIWVAPFIGRSRYQGDYEIQRKRVLSRKDKMKLEHMEATKSISKLSDEEKGLWVDAEIGKESWKEWEKNENNNGDDGSGGGGKKEKDDNGGDGRDEGDGGVSDGTPLYLIEAYKDAQANGLMASLAPPQISLLNLLPNTRYDFRLRAKIEHPTPWGDAIESPSISTEVGVPEPPVGLEISLRTHDSVYVKWGRPHDNGLPVEGFRLTVTIEQLPGDPPQEDVVIEEGKVKEGKVEEGKVDEGKVEEGKVEEEKGGEVLEGKNTDVIEMDDEIDDGTFDLLFFQGKIFS
jgi:hypothetical protein